jgi:hypothetical protein
MGVIRGALPIEHALLAVAALLFLSLAVLTLYLGVTDDRICVGCGYPDIDEDAPAVVGYGLALLAVSGLLGAAAWMLIAGRIPRLGRLGLLEGVPPAIRVLALLGSLVVGYAAAVALFIAVFVIGPVSLSDVFWGPFSFAVWYTAAGLLGLTFGLLWLGAVGRAPRWTSRHPDLLAALAPCGSSRPPRWC